MTPFSMFMSLLCWGPQNSTQHSKHWSHQCWVDGKDQLTWPAGSTLSNAGKDAICLLSSTSVLLICVQSGPLGPSGTFLPSCFPAGWHSAHSGAWSCTSLGTELCTSCWTSWGSCWSSWQSWDVTNEGVWDWIQRFGCGGFGFAECFSISLVSALWRRVKKESLGNGLNSSPRTTGKCLSKGRGHWVCARVCKCLPGAWRWVTTFPEESCSFSLILAVWLQHAKSNQLDACWPPAITRNVEAELPHCCYHAQLTLWNHWLRTVLTFVLKLSLCHSYIDN